MSTPFFITEVGTIYGAHLHEPIHHGAQATSLRVLAVAFEREAARSIRRAMRTVLCSRFRGTGRTTPLPTIECAERCVVLFAAERPPSVCDAAGRPLRSGAPLAEGTQVRLKAHLLPMQCCPGLVPLVSVVQIVREADDELLMPPWGEVA